MLTLAFFTDSTKEMRTNSVFLRQAARHKVPEDTGCVRHNTGSSHELLKKYPLSKENFGQKVWRTISQDLAPWKHDIKK